MKIWFASFSFPFWRKLHPKATCHRSLQNNHCVVAFSCCFGAKVCACGERSLICVSAGMHSTSRLQPESMLLLCELELPYILFFFPFAANEEFNGSVGGHIRFIDTVVSWNAQKYSCCVFIRFIIQGRALMASFVVWWPARKHYSLCSDCGVY